MSEELSSAYATGYAIQNQQERELYSKLKECGYAVCVTQSDHCAVKDLNVGNIYEIDIIARPNRSNPRHKGYTLTVKGGLWGHSILDFRVPREKELLMHQLS